ncbi:hypothetical protein GOP47_0017058 [Adiantum capillus-veneris]|uniref:Pentatricopeptide repeat-containing protein n=1 Tax=Adiantum capillus-veneris TaxID=13818 RepID=A0A9D4UIV0_ADICA|nr:hypothetical protein GOP47_0017058 [Adiantum capillus-veneris]
MGAQYTCTKAPRTSLHKHADGGYLSSLAQDIPPLPSIESLLYSMRTCRTDRLPQHALHLSVYMHKTGLEAHFLLRNCLVLMLLDVQCISQAQQLLDRFGFWDNYLWNATTAGYAKIGDIQSAFYLYEAAKEDARLHPSSYTFVALLKCCIKRKTVEIGHKLHSDIAKMGLLEHDVFIGSTLITMYIEFGFLAKAEEVFGMLLVRNVIVWTALMDGYTEMGRNSDILSCFEQLQEEGILSDAYTYVCALKACTSLKAISKGRELYTGVTKLGFVDEDIFVGSALVDMYLKCGSFAEAQKVFSKLAIKDVVSWSALIMGYANHGCVQDAFNSLKQMQEQGIAPNAHTFTSMLSACGTMGVAARGREVYHEIVLFGLEGELLISNSLIDVFTKCGSLVEAQVVFDNSVAQDVVSWTTLITGYTQLGEVERVFCIFYQMIEEGVKPDNLTFQVVLNACNHTGVMEMAQAYFHAINCYYELVPTLEHYNCMVDLLGRAGHIDRAVRVVEIMPLHPDVVIWHSVLGACQKWGDSETARHAFEHAVCLDDTDVGAYVCLSNTFTGAAMQKEAIDVLL